MKATSFVIRAAVVLAVVLCAACSRDTKRGDKDGFSDFNWPTPRKEDQTPLIVHMDGRWMLSAANRGQCGMNFTGAVKATEGSIAPEGGCPGSFYTSRSWAMVENKIIIRDHKGD